ncbi:hypothetical protein GPALN_006648 [Globodera pallida]|nr:hypothetical protein GPALN_006648 [Globodera pallida]
MNRRSSKLIPIPLSKLIPIPLLSKDLIQPTLRLGSKQLGRKGLQQVNNAGGILQQQRSQLNNSYGYDYTNGHTGGEEDDDEHLRLPALDEFLNFWRI